MTQGYQPRPFIGPAAQPPAFERRGDDRRCINVGDEARKALPASRLLLLQADLIHDLEEHIRDLKAQLAEAGKARAA